MDEAMVYREIRMVYQECTYAALSVHLCCSFTGTIICKSLQVAFLVGKCGPGGKILRCLEMSIEKYIFAKPNSVKRLKGEGHE